MKPTIVTAADAGFFALLMDLLASREASPRARAIPVQVLDVGLTEEQRALLAGRGVAVVEPGWDPAVPWVRELPRYFQALYARPFLPRYFPGFDVYLWIDADAWIQDEAVLAHYLGTAAAGKMAIVPEVDRGYWTLYKAPKLWTQNHKAFAWAYGLDAGYRLGRNPILNGGVWALAAEAPHWRAWQAALEKALGRRRRSPSTSNFYFHIAEQTAQNYIVFHDRLPTTFLPAYCNWFCGKGDPMWDEERGVLVEPHAPHTPLGIVHLAGKGVKERVFKLATLHGGRIETRLSYSAIQTLPRGTVVGLPARGVLPS
jgi:hypothetical protein